jgi:hypothetical protein
MNWTHSSQLTEAKMANNTWGNPKHPILKGKANQCHIAIPSLPI